MFLTYARARYNAHVSDMIYRTYVAEALRTISENTARSGGGGYLTAHLYDVLNQTSKSIDNRTHDEVVNHVLGALRAVRKGGD